MTIYLSKITDPFRNLAIEDYIFRSNAKGKDLFLYQNSPSIVMGRFQNPWLECHLQGLKKHSISLLRRFSGGGTVYHDFGNLCYCFLDEKEVYDKNVNNAFLCRSLKKIGINAKASGRSDLIVEMDNRSFKFSGSAFKQTKDRCYHHGTLLINSDLRDLAHYLKSLGKGFESKSVASNRSTVINLSEINNSIDVEYMVSFLIEEFQNEYGHTDVIIVDHEWYQKNLTEISTKEEQLRSDKWVFGETPYFTQKIERVNFSLNIVSKKAIIEEFNLDHNVIHPHYLSELSDKMKGLLYGENEIITGLLSCLEGNDVFQKEIQEVIEEIQNEFRP